MDDILKNINKIILSENGLPVQMGNLFIQSELDSLGTMIALLTIASEYNIDGSYLDNLDIPNLKVTDLVNLCKSSITST